MRGMEKMKQIMYGVTDFALMRAENGGPVTLHRIVHIFHGGDVALCEEVCR